MFQPMPARWLAVSSALLALTVSAQTPATPPAAPATTASAPVAKTQATPGQYRSALEGYQPYSENKMVPWKEANDTVGKVGGWRVYAKEAAEGQAPDGKAPASQAKP